MFTHFENTCLIEPIIYSKYKINFLRTISKVTKNKYCNRGLDISNIVIEH